MLPPYRMTQQPFTAKAPRILRTEDTEHSGRRTPTVEHACARAQAEIICLASSRSAFYRFPASGLTRDRHRVAGCRASLSTVVADSFE